LRKQQNGTSCNNFVASLYLFIQLVDEQISHTHFIQRQATGVCVCLCATVNASLATLEHKRDYQREREGERERERGRHKSDMCISMCLLIHLFIQWLIDFLLIYEWN
jgi:uncharacterized membrane protein YidH (DUF202 family)